MKYLYFTQAELEVMLELSGGSGHTLYRAGPPPDDAALTKAFATLYQRGFLSRTEGAFVPTAQGGFFRDMSRAPLAVALTVRRSRNTAALMCYCGGKNIGVCEPIRTVISEEVRLCLIPAEAVETWIFETGLLEPPALTDADAQELFQTWNGTTDSDSIRFRLEQYRNGGELLSVCEVLSGEGIPLIRFRENGRESVQPYTVEALRSMLTCRFRKESQQAL
ncbi:MAG: hypothetical protein IJR54_08515 [Oscillibacter sp.]|nr:hypothetical protein [Oscillibacter sp.]